MTVVGDKQSFKIQHCLTFPELSHFQRGIPTDPRLPNPPENSSLNILATGRQSFWASRTFARRGRPARTVQTWGLSGFYFSRKIYSEIVIFLSCQGVREALGYLVWASRPLILRFRASPTGQRTAPQRQSGSRCLKGEMRTAALSSFRGFKDLNLALILLAVKVRTKQYPMLRTLWFNYLNLYCLFQLRNNLSAANCFLSK